MLCDVYDVALRCMCGIVHTFLSLINYFAEPSRSPRPHPVAILTVQSPNPPPHAFSSEQYPQNTTSGPSPLRPPSLPKKTGNPN